MSYLHLPRVHFFGRFFADPSTVNNVPSNYAAGDNPSPVWNPNGTHHFRLVDCRVSSASNQDGEFLATPSADPLIGASIVSIEDQGVAKLVDLDTDQQGVSAIFGHRLSLNLPGGLTLIGDMHTAEANGLWICVVPTVEFGQPQGDMEASAYYQTVVEIADASWPETSGSAVLDNLRRACATVNGKPQLSLRFTVDNFIATPGPRYRTGRIAGTFGPAKQNEPTHCPGERWLVPRTAPTTPTPPWNYYLFNAGPFRVDQGRNKLIIDLANSIPLLTGGGASANVGPLNAVIAAPNSPITIGPVDYSSAAHNTQAGIVELDLTPQQVELLHSSPLQLVAPSLGQEPAAVMAENSTGLDFAVEDRVFRMAPDVPAQASMTSVIYATQWGKPAPVGTQLALQMLATILDGTQWLLPDAANCLTFSISPCDAAGRATITLKAVADPGKPADRPGNLDGQVYRIGVFAQPPPTQMNLRQCPGERTLSVHLYSAYPVQQHPTWPTVLALLAPYKPLYPAMFDLMDLTDPAILIAARHQVVHRLTAPFESPGYMPVTRDLSPNKIQTILNFFNEPRPTGPPRFGLVVSQEPDALPYSISFEDVTYPAGSSALPALQSFCAAASPTTGEWLVVGGQIRGAHGFLDPGDFSPYLYVLNLESGSHWSADLRNLPAALRDPLLNTNAQMVFDPATGTAYLLGGYGRDSKTGQMITFDTVTAFPLDEVIHAIQNGDPVEPLIRQSHDPRFAVTGGELVLFNGALYLTFGQKFKGTVSDPVSPTSIEIYTEEIRHFQLDPDTLGIQELSYGAIVDTGDHAYHRRDLNVVPNIDPDTGRDRIAIFGGVFQFGTVAAFTHPIYLDDTNTAAVDPRFSQRMNLYGCPTIAAFDQDSAAMSYTFFGGIGGYELEQNRLVKSPDLPWSNQAAMVICSPDGKYQEIILPNAIPDERCAGADAGFHLHPDIVRNRQTYANGILKLNMFQPGTKTLIGYIYGGIAAATPSTPSEQTTASNRVMAVYLTNTPAPGIPVTPMDADNSSKS